MPMLVTRPMTFKSYPPNVMGTSICLPNRTHSTNAQLATCEMTVAMAAPATPIWRAKIKMGSSTMLMMAPIKTESMPLRLWPCVMINWFMPVAVRAKTVPIR